MRKALAGILAIELAVFFILTGHQVHAAVQPCSQAGVNAALTTAGSHTFSCAGPSTVIVTMPIANRTVAVNTTLNGGGLLTLSGGTTMRLINVAAGGNLTLQNMSLVGGKSADGKGGAIDV